MMNKLPFYICGALFSLISTVHAQTAAEVKQIENYLNNLKSMQANFVQIASNGTTAEGQLYIAKPNKIRMEYNAPDSILIVGNGDYIVFNDKELDQITNIDYEDIPATLILGDDIKIDGKNIKITDFHKDVGTTSATLEYAKSGEVGPITLVFNNKPFELKQWRIVDPQSVEVTLSLYDAQTNKAVDQDLFIFKKDTSRNLNRRRR